MNNVFISKRKEQNLPERNRTRHDEKNKMFQVKGTTTRKIMQNHNSGEVNALNGTERAGGASRTNRNGK